jgi:UDP-glucose 4-epimerase
VRLLVTGANGFLGSRFAALLADGGHDVTGVARSAHRSQPDAAIPMRYGDAGDDAVAELVAGHDAILHFAGVPDPFRARRDPARAVRENVGTTVRLLEACAVDGTTVLVYPSTIRAAFDPPPDPYALTKRLGEEACRLHRARALVLRLTSVFGPGQLAAAGATGAIANFAARALADEPIVIPGDPFRTRDFVYVDDVVGAVVRLLEDRRENETVTVASGVATPLLRAAELVREAAGSSSRIETPGGDVARGDELSYPAGPRDGRVALDVRPLEEAVPLYVDWLRRHPSPQGRSRA